MTDRAHDRPAAPGRRIGAVAGSLAAVLALLAGSAALIAADARPAHAQFGISIGGIGMGGGGGVRSGRPRMGMPGRTPAIRAPLGGGRFGRMDMAPGPRMNTFPSRRPGGLQGYPGRRPGGIQGYPSRRPDGVAGHHPGRGEGHSRPDGRPRPGGRPHRPVRPPVIVMPPRGPVYPPVVVLPPGGGRPPGGPPPRGPPPTGPRGPGGSGPRIAGPALAAPALIAAARAANAQGTPGLPPPGERRYLPDEVLFVMRPGAPPRALSRVVRRFGLTQISETPSELVGTVVHRYRIPSRMTVPAAIRAMTRAAGVAYVQPNYVFDRPNYVFRLQSATATRGGAASLQYVVDTLRLPEAHLMARGEQVPIAVIDSGVEASHPEMAGRIAKSFDAVGGAFQPHEHGTGMAGAIVAHAQLVGVSPRARILAARAFAPGQTPGAQGTSAHILKAMDWAVREGARVINMSFAGPRDPMMGLSIARAAERRIVMVAAMGNEGPSAPVSFPAADPNVIAVTATDQNGRLFEAASRGKHVTVAAPGVEVLLPAPRGGYQISSGTSVAAAHVSGIAALLLERRPDLDPADLRRILRQTARQGAMPTPELGAGLADPVPALTVVAPPAPGGVPVATAPPASPAPGITATSPSPSGADTATAPPDGGPETAEAPRPAAVDPAPAPPPGDRSEAAARQ